MILCETSFVSSNFPFNLVPQHHPVFNVQINDPSELHSSILFYATNFNEDLLSTP